MDQQTKYEKELTANLLDVYDKFISLDSKTTKLCIDDLNKVVTNILEKLKEKDILFSKVYAGLYHTGSYYDGVRVAEASEFDLNVALKLPMCANEIEIDIRKVPYGYIKIQVGEELRKLRQLPHWDGYRSIDNWVSNDGFIEEGNVRKWFESILTKCLDEKSEWKDNGHSYQVKLTKSGPALTLHITRSRGVTIDVDLVPAIEFHAPKWPNLPVRQCSQVNKSWFVVPKKKNDETSKKSYWRLAFPKQEKEILNSKQRLKTTLKLLKKLRDTENWTFLSSYYIKTIFLWEVENQKYSHDFWNKSLGFLFLHMLQKLLTCLENGRIEFFWHRECNLLDNGNSSKIRIRNAYNRLKNIIKDLDKTPKDATLVKRYLVTKEEKLRTWNHNHDRNSEINIRDCEIPTRNYDSQILSPAEGPSENNENPGYRCTIQ